MRLNRRPNLSWMLAADPSKVGGMELPQLSTVHRLAASAVDPYATIEEMSMALRQREVSSEELTKDLLDRIARLDGLLHSFAEVRPEDAIFAAKKADARRRDGDDGPLLGVPLAVKDIFDVAGQATHAGSLALDDRQPTRSSNAVERLDAAGMVILGRTHMVEFAYGGWGTNSVLGAPRNPFDGTTHRVVGGSSSGSAVAVAAGFTPAALGTDTGGSIRTPAAWCGIVGLKTSVGLVGRGGVVPLAPTHDSVGPMARSVRDAALLLQVLAGRDARDPSTFMAPAVDAMGTIEDGGSGSKIGVLSARDLEGVEAPVRRDYEKALLELTALGARLKEMSLPLPVAEYLNQGGDIMSVESYALLGSYVERSRDKVDPIIADRILRGAGITAADYYRVLEARRAAQATLAERMQGFDAFVLPGSHMLPIPLAEVDESKPPNLFGRVVNYLDLASLCIPIGASESGLPTGLQIVVRKFDDAKALRIGRAFERQRGGLFSAPPVYL